RGLAPTRLPPRQTGESALWEIPLTLAFTRRPFGLWRSVYSLFARPGLRWLRVIGLLEKTGCVRKAWLNFEDPLGRRMLPFLRKLRRLALPCVCFMLHSSSLMAGGNPYTPSVEAEERIFRQIDEVLAEVANWQDWQHATVTEVARALEAGQGSSK